MFNYNNLYGEIMKLKERTTITNTLVVSPEIYRMLYWHSRYQNIHRLITHCTQIPIDGFRANGYKIIMTYQLYKKEL